MEDKKEVKGDPTPVVISSIADTNFYFGVNYEFPAMPEGFTLEAKVDEFTKVIGPHGERYFLVNKNKHPMLAPTCIVDDEERLDSDKDLIAL